MQTSADPRADGPPLRVIVAGLGVQGRKRLRVAGRDVVANVDPVHVEADYRTLKDVPLESYDAALLCVPDPAKVPMHMLSS